MHLGRPLPPRAALLLLAAALAFPGGPAAADPLPARSTHVADYDLNVRLDPDTRTLFGRERVVWRNPSQDAVSELWFHLYLNAFRNSLSTFYRESGGRLRRDSMREEGWGWIEVKSLRRADGLDLYAGGAFAHPDDDNADDRTVWRVALPQAVPPGGEIALDLEFEARLPEVYARTGYHRDYFLVGQWFPKLGVYEPAGRRGRQAGGWNCHQFHADSEFYADFGRYRAEITLPRRFVVGATGRRVERREHPDGTSTHVFEQDDVTDFAWTASPHFVEVQARFSAEREVTAREYEQAAALLGRSLDEVRLGDVELTLLLQPRHARQAERHLAAARASLKWYGLWYGRYPYRTLTIVDPAFGAGGSAGMEYPTFVTAGTSMMFDYWPFDRVLLPEEVVAHEIGHQYWQGLVASNEFEESWLDEGFTDYATGEVMEKTYGPWLAQLPFLRVGELELARAPNDPARVFDRMRSTAWGFSPGAYGFNSYARTRLTLLTLRGLLGEQVLARVLRTYQERWRFGHPSSDDFYAVASEVAGRDLGWFFGQVVERPGVFDDEVARISTRPAPEPRGVFGQAHERRTVTESEALQKEREADRAGGRQWLSTVLIRRRGEVRLPTTLELRFEGGQNETVDLPLEGAGAWEGRFRRLELTRGHRLVAAALDPGDRLPLDANRLNNARRVEPDGRVAARWGLGWVFWLQQALAAVGF